MKIVLKDTMHDGNFIEFSILYHMKEEDEGSRLVLRTYTDNRLEKELEFGWTNLVLNLFIKALKQFPLEEYDGYFSHFEKHLEFSWEYDPSSEKFNLVFDLLTDDEYTFSVRTTQKCIQEFGEVFENGIKTAPSTENYDANKE
ncbi:hypothetical protein [Brevibacillus laterosporus]|uniref:hypothetical protein n=1 Tax=Brevibacillus laterosporus TaxID=1465 RepID=UPI003D1E66DA